MSPSTTTATLTARSPPTMSTLTVSSSKPYTTSPAGKSQGVLLPYKPAGWDQIYDDFKDPDGAYTGLYIINWANVWNTNYVKDGPKEFTDFLKPEFKDKLVLTYPNDDDAVLYAFDLISPETEPDLGPRHRHTRHPDRQIQR
ncbi:hypothetical protein MPH_05812 [Macrophomina phaseolina MS6]|uniref:Uncharacterized protein n=1 Tax=Macrophomina phaseolina (strain MS6) TaxID=1126212 RepID=K2R3S9_MACPH|nr:hypothetical protein MPH_05812 [Macrophomina phaseolina MS6]